MLRPNDTASPSSSTPPRRITRSLPPQVEELERRDVPSVFYQLEAVAMTGSGPDDFRRFGDLVSIATDDEGKSTVAFVGVKNQNEGDQNDKGEESDIWVARTGSKELDSISSSPEGRVFGRGVAISGTGKIVSQDRSFISASAGVLNLIPKFDGFFGPAGLIPSWSFVPELLGGSKGGVLDYIRTWDAAGKDNKVNVATAGDSWQPDFGSYVTFQSFTAINDRGDVVYVANSLDGKTRKIEFRANGSTDPVTIESFPASGLAPRPQLTSDGHVLYLNKDGSLVLANPSSGEKKEVVSRAMGFEKIGVAPGISKDGRVVVFSAVVGGKSGIYASYPSTSGRSILRIAGGEVDDGFTVPSLSDAVAVNSTLWNDRDSSLSERGVTVAFEAEHTALGSGIYSSRISFFGQTMRSFNQDRIVTARANGITPVARIGKDSIEGVGLVTDVELWHGVSDRNRGEIAFWASSGEKQVVVRADPSQVVYLDFAPSSKYSLGSTESGIFPRPTIDLLITAGLDESGFNGEFASSLEVGGLNGDNAIVDIAAFRSLIIDQTQTYFSNAGASVMVLGGLNGQGEPDAVPWDGPDGQGHLVKYSSFQRVLIGQSPNPFVPDYGFSSTVFTAPQGPGGTLDFYNQVSGDVAVVFPDRIFPWGISLQGVDLTSLTLKQKAAAIASVIAHEAAHNFGLAHLVPSKLDGSIMRKEPTGAIDFYRADLGFLDHSYDLAEVPGSQENSRRRLLFGVGGTEIGVGPNERILDAGLSLKFSSSLSDSSLAVNRLVLGVVSGDTLPTFYDLGSGPLGELLTRARIDLPAGAEWFLFGTTDSQSVDIIGVKPGQEAILSTLQLTQLGVALEERLRVNPVAGESMSLYRLTGDTPELLGSVGTVAVPVAEISDRGAALTQGSTLGLGEKFRGTGSLTRTLTIRNAGSAPLNLGTASVAGAGYSVTQPDITTLAAGQETTLVVTLSDATAGLGLAGTLTIPSDDPDGPFVLNLRGDVIAKPRVLAVTRLDNGTGPLVVAIDFSEPLQPGPAGDARNFAIAFAGQGLPLVSATYSEVGGVNRVTLKTAASGPFAPGEYDVRFDGAALRDVSGTPVTEPISRLAVLVGDRNGLVTVGADGAGGLGVDGEFISFGGGAPRTIDGGDFDGDGQFDLVSLNSSGELMLFLSSAPAGFGHPSALALPHPVPEWDAGNSMLVTDWNSDGLADVVVFYVLTDGSGGKRLVVYLGGRGGMVLAPDMPIPVDSEAFGPLLAVGDFTGDGLPDIALGGRPVDGSYYNNTAKGSVAIYSKDPFLGYSEVARLTTGHAEWFPSGAVSADLNGDGRLDLIVPTGGYYQHNPGVVVYLGTPTGLGPAQTIDYESFGGPGIVRVGDFTGDGKLDLVIVHERFRATWDIRDGSVVEVFAGDGSGGFTALPYEVLRRRGVSLAGTADLNADGRLDLLLQANQFLSVTGEFDSTTELSVWPMYGNGDGTFRRGDVSPIAAGGNKSPGNFLLRDLTGDGYVDALYGNTFGGRIGFLTNDTTGVLRTAASSGLSTGTFQSESQAYEQAEEPALLAADFNGDGLTDLVRVANGIEILLGQSDGGYRLADSPVTSLQTRWARVGDLNGDGCPDLLVDEATSSNMMGRVYLGRGDGTFSPGPEVTWPVNGFGGAGPIIDVNRDGKLDLVFTLTGEVSGYAVYFGDGTGKLSFNANTVVSVPGLLPSYNGRAATVFDATGDGVPDIVASVDDGGLFLRVYPGKGNGTFGAPITSARPADDHSAALTPLDYDRDGNIDLAGIGGWSRWSNKVFMYRGLGGGRFEPGVAVAVGDATTQRATSVTPADFDRDGNPDMAVGITSFDGGSQWTKAVLLRGDGTGDFTPLYIDVGGDDASWFAVLDGDNWVDAGMVTLPLPAAPPAPSANNPLKATVQQGQPVVITPPSTPDIGQLITVDTLPTHGTVHVIDNGTANNPGDDTFIYQPDPGFVGTDTFTYRAGNPGGVSVGTVSITITQGPQFKFSAAAYSPIQVPDFEVALHVIRSGDTDHAARVFLQVTGGTMTSSEYAGIPSYLDFAAGETSQNITVSRNSILNPGTIEITLVTPLDTVGVISPATAVVSYQGVNHPNVFTIYGYAYRDTNDNGIGQPSEGLAGVQVYLDQNRNFILDTGEMFATTDATGYYALLLPYSEKYYYYTATHPDSSQSMMEYRLTTGFQHYYQQDWVFNNQSFTSPPPTPNSPPTISDVPNQSSTGSPIGPVTFTIGDAETATDKLVVTLKSSNSTLVPLANIVLGGSGANRTVTATPVSGRTGISTITITVADNGGLTTSDTFSVAVTAPPGNLPSPTLVGFREFAAGNGAAGTVRFFNPDGFERFILNVFPGFTGGIRTAAGDFTGDGIADFVVGTGPGGATHVKVFNGATKAELFSVDPFEAAFTGGVYVAAGDITGDGVADLVITPDEGGGPRVRAFTGNGFTQIADFFGIDDKAFRGGARSAIGDLNGDGSGDLVVVAGFGGGPRVAAFDGVQLQSNGGPKLFNDFFAFEQALRNGIFVAAGDVNGDGFADLVAAGGPGGGPRVFILDGQSLVQNGSSSLVPLGNFFAGNPASRGGVRVAIKNLDSDAKADIVTGAGSGAGSRVTAYLGKNISPAGSPPAFLDFDAFPGFGGGVFVG